MTNAQTALPPPHRDRLGKTLGQTKDACIALSVCILAVALAACSLNLPSGKAANHSSIPRCADLEARALVSPNAPVSGVFACLTPALAQANNFKSDADLQAIAAQPPVYTSYRYLGHTTYGYYFEFSSDQTVAGCFRFHVNSTGHVDQVASKQGACPKPLPQCPYLVAQTEFGLLELSPSGDGEL